MREFVVLATLQRIQKPPLFSKRRSCEMVNVAMRYFMFCSLYDTAISHVHTQRPQPGHG